jgi:hypothetical protein
MKNLILSLSLTLGLIVAGASSPLMAQETVTQTENAQQDDESTNSIRIGDGGFKIDVDFDGDDNNQEKLDKVAKVVGKVLSEDVGKELSVEFKTLNNDEKEELVKVIQQGFSFDMHDSDEIPAGVLLLALPAIVLFFGTPVFLLIVLLHSGYKKRRQKMELVTMYLQADRELPPHVMNAFDNGGAASSLRSGISLAAIGLGLVVAFNVSGDGDVAAFGFIPLFIGVGRLAFWFLEERKHDNTEPTNLIK